MLGIPNSIYISFYIFIHHFLLKVGNEFFVGRFIQAFCIKVASWASIIINERPSITVIDRTTISHLSYDVLPTTPANILTIPRLLVNVPAYLQLK